MTALLEEVAKGLRYLAQNPRYFYCYFLGDPARIATRVTGRQPAMYGELRREIAEDPDLVRLIREVVARTTQEDFVLDEDHVFLYALTRLVRPRRILETGVFDGTFSACILQGLHVNAREGQTEGELVSIDLPSYGPITGSTSNMRRTSLPAGCEPGWLVPGYLRSRWRLHLGDSRELLPSVAQELGGLDLFFHDSLHTYEHMRFEYETVWPHMNTGAILLSHDVHWNRAFREFARARRLKDFCAHGFGLVRKAG